MNKHEFNCIDLMELERLNARFSRGIPSIEEIDKGINALSIVDKLNSEVKKLESECGEYQKQMTEILEAKRSQGKKRYSYLIVLFLFFLCIIAILFILYKIIGFKFMEFIRWMGILSIILGIVSGVVGILVAKKEYSIKRQKQMNINMKLAEVQEKIDSTKGDIQKIQESTKRVMDMVRGLLEKYGERVEKASYREKLIELRNDVVRYMELKTLK